MPKTKPSKIEIVVKDVLVHSCFSQRKGDPYVPRRCRCKKWITREEARLRVALGDADWKMVWFLKSKNPFPSRTEIVEEQDAKTPRSNTIEKAHMTRNIEGDEEEAASINVYQELMLTTRCLFVRGMEQFAGRLILEEDGSWRGTPILWDEMKDPFRGRVILVLFGYDLRTCVGVDVEESAE